MPMMLANCLSLGSAQRGAARAPEDWRLPVTQTTRSGGADASSFQTAQASAAAKTRPSWTINSAATDWIAWQITPAIATSGILSFAGASVGTPTVEISSDSTDGSDGTWASLGYVDHYPTGSDVGGSGSGRRQHCVIAAGAAGRWVRLTIAAGGSARTVAPLLHLVPASGPWDAHVAFGASREDQGMGSTAMETSIIAAFPNRDPIVFNYALSSQTVDGLAGIVDDLVTAYEGVTAYATLGSILGNDITADRAYDGAEKAALDADIDTIVETLQAAGMSVGFGNTSYRAYTGAPVVTPDSQAGGSLEYNDNVTHPKILEHTTASYDGSLGRARIDEYLLTLKYRSLLADQVHGTAGQYTEVRAMWVDSWYRYLYTGSWGTSQVEQRVAAAEATPTEALYNEGDYAVSALTASSAKTALEARLAVVYPLALLDTADDLITAAEASRLQADIDTAQTALDAAETAGADPSTVSDYQDRIDAIVPLVGITVKIGHGGTGAVAGWNRSAAITVGVAIADLLDDTGASTGWGYEITNAATSTTTGMTGVAGGFWVPDDILVNGILDTANSIVFKLTGLNDAKLYNLKLMPSRSSSPVRAVKYTVNGAVQADIEAAGNLTVYATVNDVVPVSGEITVTVARGTGSSFTLHNASSITQHDP
jgi:hypothetical protein